jgi:hypothetical protein
MFVGALPDLRGCESTIGGTFVPDSFWSARYDDTYFFGGFVC